VYSRDVTQVIVNKLRHSEQSGVYNLACAEKVTLKEFYDIIIESLGGHHPHEESYTVKQGKANKIYPSVICGPIDISRAKEKLGFSPTSLVSDC